ncbi:Poly [ADP-ribose] polymerase 3 [Chionoecetes opilio]|uniref:Poly [ADP-ribose] polymerase n=1 Tax=Chionoecetes opilio TaxID=41210 RepID=A0A8J5BVE8_CHIOP|nr:Poly [ADP-ribose] polymerase 3 [Chionoecetes opilio]
MLDCAMELIDKKTTEFKLLEEYSKACKDTRKGALLDIWSMDRKGECDRFQKHDDLQNRKLLWHGTSVAVVAAILKAGLRIMPHSGGLVGKGIYFASEHAKSSRYGKLLQEEFFQQSFFLIGTTTCRSRGLL